MHQSAEHVQAVAVIPARGGSKSIERKNLAMVGGRSLLHRSIAAASEAAAVGTVVVSTDDSEIAEEAKRYGATVVERPANLASDSSRSIEAVLHVITEMNLDERTVVAMLQATSPFTTGIDVDAAIGLLSTGSVVSVTRAEHHPFKSCIVVDGQLAPVAEVPDLEAPRQLLPVAVRPNGAIYVARVGALAAARRFFIEPVLPYTMGAAASLDVDTQADLDLANSLVTDD